MEIGKYDPSIHWGAVEIEAIKKDGPARLEKLKDLLGIEKWIKESHDHKAEALFISLRGWKASEDSLQKHFMILKIIKELKDRKKSN
jgi:hypothetical protein